MLATRLMRVLLAFLVVGCATAGCWDQAQCNAIMESQVTLDAHLAMTPDKLAGATLTFCRNGACATGGFDTFALPDGGTSSARNAQLTGAPFAAYADRQDEGDGFTKVEFALPAGGLALRNGDTYGATVTSASGATLFQVSRPAVYDTVDTCNSDSQQVRMELYPDSASGLSCGNAWCDAGVHVDGSFTTSATSAPVTITLCRDTLCATGDVALASLTAPDIEQGGSLRGALLATVTLTRRGDSVSYDVESSEDTAALHDGDLYTLTITQGAVVRVTGVARAEYSARFLNGPACDPVACHTETLHIP